jgi:hypothetical protein
MQPPSPTITSTTTTTNNLVAVDAEPVIQVPTVKTPRPRVTVTSITRASAMGGCGGTLKRSNFSFIIIWVVLI